MGPPSRSAVGVVGEWRIAQRLPGDRPRGQNKLDTLKAHPHPRVHCPSRTLPRGTQGLSHLTIIALIGCIHALLSSKGTPDGLHRPYMRKGCPRFIFASRLWRMASSITCLTSKGMSWMMA